MMPETIKIAKGDPLSFALESSLAELDKLHAVIETFGHLNDMQKKQIFEVNLVLEEIFTNIVSYGHTDDKSHQVEFSVALMDNTIKIGVMDDGVPFNLLEAESVDLDADLEERAVGGLGIHLVRKLMDGVNYQRKDDKNIVNLSKKLEK